MNPNELNRPRPKSAATAQQEISRRQKVARADHIILERHPDTGATRVVVDGEELDIPDFARISCGLASDRPMPTVTITIHAKRVQILTKNIDIEGVEQ